MDRIDIGIKLIKEINDAGYEAYIVGGATRDYILGLDIYDIDITTSMPISLIKEKYNVTNSKNPYLSIKLEYEGIIFEITNFRSDIKYLDNRHPEVALAKSLHDDLIRRDFTINSICLDKDKNIIDEFNGKEDINNKIIRLIGDKEKRFQEDSLRILRAIYFSSKLNFSIEDETLSYMMKYSYLLSNLSSERLFEYFNKILYEPYNKGIEYINRYDLFYSIEYYKIWLNIASNLLSIEENMVLYSIKFNEYPPYLKKKVKVDIDSILKLYNNKFQPYYLFLYKDLIEKYKKLFIYLDLYDYLILKIQKLRISSVKELALSQNEIASYFDGEEIKLKIELVIKNILDGKLENNREEIIKFLGA